MLNPPFVLRPATAEDFPAIRRLIRQVGINPLGLDWRRFILAVTPAGSMIGCGQVKPHGDGSRELASIAVVPEWRNRGVARAIIEHLLENHPGVLYLTCRPNLEPFYNRFGFRVTRPGELTAYFRRLLRLTSMLKRAGVFPGGPLVMVRGL
jgi:N-acetylglutamate synthase-like GNAT family acetyltransferase